MLFKDWKRAALRAPLHLLMSVPFAAAALVAPPLGKRYISWRVAAEKDDEVNGRDTPEKAAIDLYTQTALVHRVLGLYGIKASA